MNVPKSDTSLYGRMSPKKWRQGTLPPARYKRLEEIEFSFNRNDMDKWLVKYNLLLNFMRKWAS